MLRCSYRTRARVARWRVTSALKRPLCRFVSKVIPRTLLSHPGAPHYVAVLTRRHNNDHQQDDDTNDNAHPHLHILPPHLLSHAVGAASEAIRLGSESIGLVLQAVEALAAFGSFVDVALHLVDCVVDFL